MKLQIGCGKNKLEEYTTIDKDANVYPSFIAEADNLYMFDDRCIDIIYASHIFEYYDWHDAENIVLPEWRRILKEDGILRIAVPDFEQMIRLYNTGIDLSFFIGPLYGRWKNDSETIYHKTVYDYKTLSGMLDRCGFYSIKKWDWREIHPKDFDDYSKSYIPHMEFEKGVLISLNIECKRGEEI